MNTSWVRDILSQILGRGIYYQQKIDNTNSIKVAETYYLIYYENRHKIERVSKLVRIQQAWDIGKASTPTTQITMNTGMSKIMEVRKQALLPTNINLIDWQWTRTWKTWRLYHQEEWETTPGGRVHETFLLLR